MTSLPGYDAWKLRSPYDDEPEGDPDPDCTCYGTRLASARRACVVHGRDPDAEADRRAEDREAEREMDDDDGDFANDQPDRS